MRFQILVNWFISTDSLIMIVYVFFVKIYVEMLKFTKIVGTIVLFNCVIFGFFPSAATPAWRKAAIHSQKKTRSI